MNDRSVTRAKPRAAAARWPEPRTVVASPSFVARPADAGRHSPDDLDNELKPAIATGAIVPYYQPLVCLGDGKIAGFEILARWNHPARGLLVPQDFIAQAENTGLIGDLCLGLLELALADARHWNDAGSLSINIAPVQFCDGRLAEKILSVLTAANFPAGCLVVELTETGVIRDLTLTKTTLAKLKRAGVRVAIDDFGKGCSGLGYLSEMPFDMVKIDRSFVTARRSNSKSASILSAMLALCTALGVVSVAEGIENEMNAEWLRAQGCTLGQGFLYARPMPAGEVPAFMHGRDIT